MKGNPWSNVSSQFPTPPKAPTARTRPSAGAQRYTNFETPRQSAYQAAQNGPDSRQNTYDAFDRMRHRAPKPDPPGPGKTWAAPPPPPRGTPKSGREESDARAREEAQRAKTRPPPSSFEEYYQDMNTSHRRSQSSHASNRKGGFQPNTPGGDEPPAPRGSYSTARDKPATAPPPPPRHPPSTSTSDVTPDPLAQFRKQDVPSMETRPSQPYAAHGGEKFNLYGSPNMSRSKSTREGNGRFDDGQVPRTGSDSNLNTPQRTRSSAQRSSASTKPAYQSARVDSSSSDDMPEMNGSRSGPTVNKSNGSAPRAAPQAPDAAKQADPKRKHSKISLMRQWMNENPGKEPPPDGFPSDGPPLRSGQASPATNGTTNVSNGTNGKPTMYATPTHPSFKLPEEFYAPPTFFSFNHSTAARNVSQKDDITQRERSRYFASMPESTPKWSEASARTPSGLAADSSQDLNAFEQSQKAMLDLLITNKNKCASSLSQRSPDNSFQASSCQPCAQPAQNLNGNARSESNNWTFCRDPDQLGSPSKKTKQNHRHPSLNIGRARAYYEYLEDLKKPANGVALPRFTFPVTNDTFSTTQSRANRFSSSADNISTKFTPEDWDGKFAAGGDYFKPGPTTPHTPRSQSTSRTRGRSPPKTRTTTDPKFMPTAEPETSVESPGGTKFSAEQWKETFKPQTFMPPMNPNVPPRPQVGRKRTIPNTRPTMGGRAAVVDESDTSDEAPIFAGRRASSPQASVPEPMDVDTPPAARTVPQFAPAQVNEKLNLNTDPLKRPAASSASQSPTDEADLKVNFADLNLGTFMSSLDMPSPVAPPRLPELSESERPTYEAFNNYMERFGAYMNSWDEVHTKFLLHMASRKTQNLASKEKRWTDDKVMEAYRAALREDQAVLARWNELTEKHERVVKECAIMRERMNLAEQVKVAPRPRKKTH